MISPVGYSLILLTESPWKLKLPFKQAIARGEVAQTEA